MLPSLSSRRCISSIMPLRSYRIINHRVKLLAQERLPTKQLSRSRNTRSNNAVTTMITLQYRRHFANMPVPQSSRAKLFQGHAAREGWEATIYAWYTCSLVLLVAILQYAPHTEIEAWAREEALLRLQSGKTITFGEHLSAQQQQTCNNDNADAAVAATEIDDSLKLWDKFAHRAVQSGKDDDDEQDVRDEVENDEDQLKLVTDEKEDHVPIMMGQEEEIDDESMPPHQPTQPGLWRRITNLFSALPGVQEDQSETDDEEDDENEEEW